MENYFYKILQKATTKHFAKEAVSVVTPSKKANVDSIPGSAKLEGVLPWVCERCSAYSRLRLFSLGAKKRRRLHCHSSA